VSADTAKRTITYKLDGQPDQRTRSVTGSALEKLKEMESGDKAVLELPIIYIQALDAAAEK
jgi:hypothetical protein